MSKHTPGPWVVKIRAGEWPGEFSVFQTDRTLDTPLDASLSNARLIAAAPDLLEVAKLLSLGTLPIQRDELAELREMARAAIAKARGAK